MSLSRPKLLGLQSRKKEPSDFPYNPRHECQESTRLSVKGPHINRSDLISMLIYFFIIVVK